MARYSEDYNLRISLNDMGVLGQLEAIDAIANKLDRKTINIGVSLSKGSATTELTSLATIAERLDADNIKIDVSTIGSKQAMADMRALEMSQKRMAQTANINARTDAQLSRTRILNATEASKVEQEALRVQSMRQMNANRETAGLNAQMNLMNKLNSASRNWAQNLGSTMSGVGKIMNHTAETTARLSQTMQQLATPLLVGGGILAGGAVVGVASQVKGAIQYKMQLEQAQGMLKAQGLSTQQVADILQKQIVPFANQSPFDVTNLTESVAGVNAYIGDIQKAYKATQVFGTSLFASGRDPSALANVGVNLGQLYSGEFTKVDYKELIKNVPAMSQALREYGINGWEDFNKALGDDPTTKAIERRGNALDLVVSALDKYNKKTNALVEANKPLANQLENLKGQWQTQRNSWLESSGLYDKFTKVIQTGAKKLMSPEVADVMQSLFKSLNPWMDKLSNAIEKFDIKKFVQGWQDGFNSVKNTVMGIVNSPIVKGIGKMIAGAVGAKGDEGDIGRVVGGMLSAGISLGVGSIALKGVSSIAGLSGGVLLVGGQIFSMVGKAFSKMKAPASMTQQVANAVGNTVSTGLETAVPMGVKSGLGKFGTFLKGAGASIAVVDLAAISFFGIQFINEKVAQEKMNTTKKGIETIRQIASQMPEVGSEEANSIKKKIDSTRQFIQIISSIGGDNTLTAFSEQATIASGVIGGIVGAFNPLAGLAITGLVGGASVLSQVIGILAEKREQLKLETVTKATQAIAGINALPNVTDPEGIKTKIQGMFKILDAFKETGGYKPEGGKNGQTNSTLGDLIQKVSEMLPTQATKDLAGTLANLTNVSSAFDQLAGVGDIGDKVVAGITNLKNTINKVRLALSDGSGNGAHAMGPQLAPTGGATGDWQNLSDFSNAPSTGGTIGKLLITLQNVLGDESQLQQLSVELGKLNALSATISAIPVIDPNAIGAKIRQVVDTILRIQTELNAGQEVGSYIGGADSVVVGLQVMQKEFDQVKVLADKMAVIGGSALPDLTGQINNLLRNISALNNGNISGAGNGAGIAGIASALDRMRDAIGNAGGASGKLNPLISNLKTVGTNADTSKGKLTDLAVAINTLPSEKKITITVIDNATTAINNILRNLNSIQTNKTVNVNTNYTETGKKPAGNSAIGGVFAKGGFVSSIYKNAVKSLNYGQDTIHAMLSQGEAVLRRSATQAVGKNVIDSLNAGKIQQAYAQLGNKMATMYNNNMYNQQTYNNAPTINQNFYGNNQSNDGFLRQVIRGI